MSITLKSELSGVETDIKALQDDFYKAMEFGMSVLADNMQQALLEHISDDVYSAFMPVEYERRYYDGGLVALQENTETSSDRDSAKIEYNPSGESEQWGSPLDGDALIQRIETGIGYEWMRQPGPRPFFQNFTSEMVDGGRAEVILVESMNLQNPKLGVTIGGDSMERDGTEWEG